MDKEGKLTSRELEKLLKVSRDTLKHWRYGYYTGASGKKVYYREDKSGVPCTLEDAKQYKYYVYDLEAVHKWITLWKTKSSKKNHILSVVEKMKGK